MMRGAEGACPDERARLSKDSLWERTRVKRNEDKDVRKCLIATGSYLKLQKYPKGV